MQRVVGGIDLVIFGLGVTVLLLSAIADHDAGIETFKHNEDGVVERTYQIHTHISPDDNDIVMSVCSLMSSTLQMKFLE